MPPSANTTPTTPAAPAATSVRRASVRTRRPVGDWWTGKTGKASASAGANASPWKAKRPRSPVSEGVVRKRRRVKNISREGGDEGREEVDKQEEETTPGTLSEAEGEEQELLGEEPEVLGEERESLVEEQDLNGEEREFLGELREGGTARDSGEDGTATATGTAASSLREASLDDGDARGTEESFNRSDVDMGVDEVYGAGVHAPPAHAEAASLQFHRVAAADGGAGNVDVAIAITVNSSYSGVLEVPPQTDTGAQRALIGDEFFFVHAGSVTLDLGPSRYFLREGDHVAVPNMASYSFHNTSLAHCRLVFFVPRNPFG